MLVIHSKIPALETGIDMNMGRMNCVFGNEVIAVCNNVVSSKDEGRMVTFEDVFCSIAIITTF